MVSVYLKNRDGFSENGIFPEIMNNEKLPAAERMLPRLTDDAKLLMVAGTDAPSQVLAITMFHILHDQSVYRKCQGELEDNIPNPQDIPPLRVLERLPYLVSSKSTRPSLCDSSRPDCCHQGGASNLCCCNVPPSSDCPRREA